LQAVNLVNGMIVDGLGHVSLDNGPGVANSNGLGQPNIHQGSILATGRNSKDVGHSVAVAANGIAAAAAAGLSTPMSAANSLQFNQLIGGGVSPNLLGIGGGCHTTMSMASATSQQGLNLTQSASSTSSNHYGGDYVHGGLGSNAGASTAAGAPPATAFKH
jgi:hypothetical protein